MRRGGALLPNLLAKSSKSSGEAPNPEKEIHAYWCRRSVTSSGAHAIN
ncbi:MAG: hypothetical protein ACREQ5_02125 [Candidatus Dormibacteria bacterium]